MNLNLSMEKYLQHPSETASEFANKISSEKRLSGDNLTKIFLAVSRAMENLPRKQISELTPKLDSLISQAKRIKFEDPKYNEFIRDIKKLIHEIREIVENNNKN